MEEYLDLDNTIERMAKNVQKRIDKGTKWIPVIVAIISAVASILVGTFGWAKKEEIDNLKSVVETQNEKIDELESQIEVLIDDTEEK